MLFASAEVLICFEGDFYVISYVVGCVGHFLNGPLWG